jgi:hypothetical protein
MSAPESVKNVAVVVMAVCRVFVVNRVCSIL